MNEQEREAFEAYWIQKVKATYLPDDRTDEGYRDSYFHQRWIDWQAARKGMVPPEQVQALFEAVRKWREEAVRLGPASPNATEWVMRRHGKDGYIFTQLNAEGGDDE